MMQEQLPLVKQRDAAQTLPDGDALKKILVLVSNTTKTAEYFATNYKSILERAKKAQELAPLLSEIFQFVHNVALKEKDKSAHWRGETPQVANQNFQQNLVAEAESISPPDAKVMFGYVIDNQSNYSGGFLIGKDVMDEKNSESMNIRFNGWLSQNNMKKEGGVIFNATREGELLQSTEGEPIRTDPDTLRALIEDKENGFAAYLQNPQPPQTPIDIVTHHFTDDELEVLQKHAETELDNAAISASSQGG